MRLLTRSKTNSKSSRQSLKAFNLIIAGLLLVQAILVVVLGNSEKGSQPINIGFLGRDTVATSAGSQSVYVPASHLLFDLNIAFLLAAFLIIYALINFLSSTRYKKVYDNNLKQGISKPKWLTFGIIGGLLFVTVAMLCGFLDITVLAMIFIIVATAGIINLRTEKVKSLSAFRLSMILIAIPTIAILAYTWSAHAYGNGLPTYVYFLILSLLLYLILFLINSYLQLRKLGRWENNLFVEKIFVLLSFLMVSAVTWQVFAGTLR